MARQRLRVAVLELFGGSVERTGMTAPPHLPRHRVPITLAVVLGTLVIAGCGSSSKPSSRNERASNLAAAAIRFASCVRSRGVPNFPDPTTSGDSVSFSLKSSSGINAASPSFQAAQEACGKLLPGSGAGSGKPSAATETQMLAISRCMRAHGVTGFPDPATTPPSTPIGYSGVLTRNGVSFAIPTTIDIQSPAVQQAASACHLGGLGRGAAGGGSL